MIEEVGVLSASETRRGNINLKISAVKVLEDLEPGDSIAVNGPCLTVTETGNDWFRVEAAQHTVEMSTVGRWRIGKHLNLERALKVGDRLGGHIVQGHVDGIGKVTRLRYNTGSTDIHLGVPSALIKLLAPKGSVSIDGVSLTLTSKSASGLSVMVVPFTFDNTTLRELKSGDNVNIETDLIIRWLAERFPEGEVINDPDYLGIDRGNIHLED